MYTGAAPISLETLRYFQSINLPLMEAYGMSECSGVATMCLPQLTKTSAVGKKLPDIELKILNEDEDGGGEVWIFDDLINGA